MFITFVKPTDSLFSGNLCKLHMDSHPPPNCSIPLSWSQNAKECVDKLPVMS